MRWLIIVSGLTFLVGNMTWHRLGDPKIMWVPLSLFLFFLLYHAADTTSKHNRWQYYLLQFLTVLAVGHIVKQVSYKDGDQTWDYVWGAIVTVLFIVWLFIKDKKWVNRLLRTGRS